jgi:Family of unknown function (DUF6585)
MEREAPPARISPPPQPERVPEPRELFPTPTEHAAADAAPQGPAEVFRTKLIWQAIPWACAIVCFGIVAVAASQLIDVPEGKTPQAGVYGVVAMFTIGMLAAGYVGFRFAGQKYEVFHDRLVQWQHFSPTTIRWNQIREVFQETHPAWIKYHVVMRGGNHFTVSSEMENYKRLGELISGHVADLLMPAAWHEIEAGRDVHFGPLHVNANGVVVEGQLEPWHRVGVLTFAMNNKPVPGTSMISNMVHVRIGSAFVEMGTISNFCLFERLAQRLVPASVVA